MSIFIAAGIATPIFAVSTLRIVKARRLRRERDARRDRRDAEVRRRMGLKG